MKLYFHILKAHIGPFLFAFITLMFIFLLQFLMRAIDQLVGKGLSALIIGELIVLSLSWMVVLAVPMAVLVATLMAFGKLSSQNEITAMKASGMSLYRMMSIVVIASVILTYLLVQFNNKVLPEANHRLKVLLIDIRRTKPTLTITGGLFSQDIPGYSILARKTFEQSNDLEGITIYDYTDPSTNIVITAEKGKVSFTPDYRKLIMDLFNGEIHQVDPRDMQTYRRMDYRRHRIMMDAEGFEFERSSVGQYDRSDRELSAQVMQAIVDSLEHANRLILEHASTMISVPSSSLLDPSARFTPVMIASVRQRAINSALTKARNIISQLSSQISLTEYNSRRIDEFLVEINKKYSLPAACIVFVFIGAPLGIIARRGTFGVAATFSLGFFILYWASLIGGEKLADRDIISPWLGMWMANIVLFILGIYLTLRMGRETPTINWSAFRRWVPKYLRSPEPTEPEQYERS
ncbi:MAG: LptF/LptG family permease [Ignavibacteriales bacterium]|nr:LptF/LptG family permease [Ignavibacteriales bacterium]